MTTRLDALTIEVLADGTIRTSSDAVSGANHATAEAFLRELGRLTGGEASRIRRKEGHTHAHGHAHDHEHDHHH
jgi:hypothetical protein